MSRRKPAPPPNWSPHEWAPLSEALIQIGATVGPLTLALHDLYQDLLNGWLESALRQISRDGQETWRLLRPSDWQQWRVREERIKPDVSTPNVKVWLYRDIDLKDPKGWRVEVTPIDKGEAVDGCYFFVLRADLNKRYPATTTSDRRTDDGRRKPGPKIKNNWKLHVAAKAHRIYEEERRIPTAKELAEFCVCEWDYQPDESEIHKLLRNLLDG